jgi:outer membrane receptor for ferric coprogen and ferric-rhodotorulic acid
MPCSIRPQLLHSESRRPLRLVYALAAMSVVSLSSAQTAPAPAPDAATPGSETKAAPVPVTKVAVPSQAGEETIELSPFQVVADTKGYFTSNTMSGTRLNSKIEDLGQSITVMNKQQMADFAMLDINDVFDYMASTEGTGSYSQFDTDRTGAVVDQVSLNPNNANRVRGIGNANIAFNNMATTGRVPIDPLWLESLEVSRGPNANIFGLGNASGTVNQVPATANLSREFTRVEVRGDSYDGWRTSLDLNRVILKNKVAVRASYANEHTGFVRKPSGEDARRLSAEVKAQPFKNTTISLNWYSYKNASNAAQLHDPARLLHGLAPPFRATGLESRHPPGHPRQRSGLRQ